MTSEVEDKMSIDEVLDVLCEALELVPGSLRPETRIDQVEAWDSIGWMNVVAMTDSRFNVQLAPSDTGEFLTVGDVARHIVLRA